MERDRWDTRGDAEMTDHWRSVVPALSLDPAGDQTDVANGWARAVGVRRRYALELKHLAQSERSAGSVSVTTRLTRISDWSPLTGEERDTHRPGSPFALSRGIPSGLIAGAGARVGTGLDYALLISIAPLFLPAGALFLEGVPLVVHRIRRFRPLPWDADVRWPVEPAVPAYPI
jgi:hypothetical protein